MTGRRRTSARPPGKRAKYLGPVRRRPQILELAASLFAARGFSLPLDQIAKEAGLSKAVLYDCFPGGKEELQVKVIERAEGLFCDEVVEALQERTGDAATLVNVAVQAFLRFAERDAAAFDLLFGSAEMPGQRMRLRLRLVRARIDKVLTRLLMTRLREAGVDAERGDIVALLGVASALAAQATGTRRAPLSEAVVSRATDVVARGLGGRLAGASMAVG
ncbi:MAG TPA: TetR/AcrR family transcriptional regulator [Actinomycetota bacterium]|jgi:AcrR family transcriptional regulator